MDVPFGKAICGKSRDNIPYKCSGVQLIATGRRIRLLTDPRNGVTQLNGELIWTDLFHKLPILPRVTNFRPSNSRGTYGIGEQVGELFRPP